MYIGHPLRRPMYIINPVIGLLGSLACELRKMALEFCLGFCHNTVLAPLQWRNIFWSESVIEARAEWFVRDNASS